MNAKGQGALEYLIIIAAVLAIAAIVVTMLTGVLEDQQQRAMVTSAQEAASSCHESLVVNMLEPGNYSEDHKNICGNICQGTWLDEKVGGVTSDAEDILEAEGYDPGTDDLVDDGDYWVRGACMSGMPGWIVDS